MRGHPQKPSVTWIGQTNSRKDSPASSTWTSSATSPTWRNSAKTCAPRCAPSSPPANRCPWKFSNASSTGRTKNSATSLARLLRFSRSQPKLGTKVIKPYHKSLADWLADEAKAGPYFVSRKEGHRMLADYSRVWWSQDSYALAHLPYHLAWCQEWAALSSLLINAEFISTKRARLGYASLAQDYKTVDEYHFQ